ncbi:short-chain dehydrogenase/reductase [Streptomyces azureus]|uniref:Short-chain dehydrogenase/reductase n=1 Tax=Streptomyces azureus TaxID=146537 RepID=A0A0K8PIH8_STRAJ|nr:short-chain dehydrogenase/reductase [Streptomyces azureus]
MADGAIPARLEPGGPLQGGGGDTDSAYGDPARLAAAIYDTTRHPNPPLRLTLGSDTYDAIHTAFAERLDALEFQRISRHLSPSPTDPAHRYDTSESFGATTRGAAPPHPQVERPLASRITTTARS